MRVWVFMMLSCGFRFHSKLLLLLFYGDVAGVPAAVSVLWLRTVLKLNTVSRFPKLLNLWNEWNQVAGQMVLWLRSFNKIRQRQIIIYIWLPRICFFPSHNCPWLLGCLNLSMGFRSETSRKFMWSLDQNVDVAQHLHCRKWFICIYLNFTGQSSCWSIKSKPTRLQLLAHLNFCFHL